MTDPWILTTDQLREEERWLKLSRTEQELESIRSDLLEGKIKRFDDPEYDGRATCYEDAIGCVLFWAVQDGKISEEEHSKLYEKFK